MPPFAAVSAEARVNDPSAAKLEDAVAPKRAVLAVRTFANSVVPVAFVNVNPPLKFRSVVVAFEGKRYAKFW